MLLYKTSKKVEFEPDELLFIDGDEIVIIGSEEGHIMIHNIADGESIFEQKFNSAVVGFSTYENVVFFALEEGVVGCIYLESMKVNLTF